jgi:tetratricopeptide (TPR) repeat protein
MATTSLSEIFNPKDFKKSLGFENAFENRGALGLNDEPKEQAKQENPSTIGFLGREKELKDLHTFFYKSTNFIFEIRGVPLIGKTELTKAFCLRNNIKYKRISLKTANFNPVETIQEEFFKTEPWCDFTSIDLPRLLIIDNFDSALELSSQSDKKHKIKDNKIHDFINGLLSNDVKLIIESRSQVRFDNGQRWSLYHFDQLKAIPVSFFWDFYRANNYSESDFDKICKKFNEHTGLLALANKNIDLLDYKLLNAIYEPKAISRDLWIAIRKIIDNLEKPERQLLIALMLLQRHITDAELQNCLDNYITEDIYEYLQSLKFKLLITVHEGKYVLNSYIAEVCYDFFKKCYRNEIEEIKKLPIFKNISEPQYDPVYQDGRNGEQAFFDWVKKEQKAKNFEIVMEMLGRVFEVSPVPQNILTSMGFTYKLQNKYQNAEMKYSEAWKDYKHAPARNELGIMQKDKGNKIQAIKIFEELTIDIDDPKKRHIPAYCELAIIYKEDRNLDKSEQLLLEAKSIDPADEKTLTELALIHIERIEYTEAKALLEEAIRLAQQKKNRQDVTAINILAKVYKLEGNIDKALGLVNRGLEIEPNNYHLKENKKDLITRQSSFNGIPNNTNNEPTKKKKIVFLSADPDGKKRFGQETQMEDIKGLIEDIWDFKSRTNTIYNQIRELTEDKDIVHITVHCADDKLYFRDEQDNNEQPLNIEFLCHQLEGVSKQINIILLIACKSENIAKVLNEKGLAKYVIGTTKDIIDETAIGFSKKFYSFLKTKFDVESAFKDTCFYLNNDPKLTSYFDEKGNKVTFKFEETFKLFTKNIKL